MKSTAVHLPGSHESPTEGEVFQILLLDSGKVQDGTSSSWSVAGHSEQCVSLELAVTAVTSLGVILLTE